MATVPLSGTNIRFLSGVPFNNDYKNTRWFTSKATQESYFKSKPIVHSEAQMNFQRIEGRNYISISKSTDDLWNTNYVMFQNASYNNKWFYAFVTKLEYRQKNTTHVHFEIDVLQTWKFDMEFKPSYVSREHRPLWNADGTPVINTIDEGLNYGTEYDNALTTRVREMSGGYKWLVIVTKSPIESGDELVQPTEVGMPQPLSYYIVPFKENDITPTVKIKGTPLPVSKPLEILEQITKKDATVNNVVSLFVTDYTGIETTFEPSTGSGDIITFPNSGNGKVRFIGAPAGGGFAGIKVDGVVKFHNHITEVTNDKYLGFKKDTESKLLMYPYCLMSLDDYRGSRTDYKLEHISGKALKLIIKGSLGLSNKVSYGISEYNNNDVTHETERSNETALISDAPNDLPIINDMLAAFLQGKRNSLETQKKSIIWNATMGSASSAIGIGASVKNKNPFGVASGIVDVGKGVGDSVLQMQAIQAKQADIANTPPNIQKMGSNTAYDYGNNYQGVYVLRKQIKPEYRKILGDFFNMFGYKTNEVKIPNFRTRQNWNYVETVNCTILGNFNNEDIAQLKAVFDNGITLWHTEDVGNYALSNGVR